MASGKIQVELFHGLGAKVIALFRAYIDESGMHGDAQVIIVGVAITTVSSWDRFSADCAPFLKKHGLKFFSTSDFYASKGEFEGWEIDKKRAFANRFIPILNKPPKKIIVSQGLQLAQFKAIHAEFPKIRTTPYKYCLISIASKNV
jgi:hypothetical protein